MNNVSADGPYDTEQQAAETCRPIYAKGALRPGGMADLNLERLTDACDQAAVEIGDFDRRILAWLARWEPETVAVIVGVITRANGGTR